jgi:hypothetical protein
MDIADKVLDFEHGVGVEARFCGFGVFKSKTKFY